jgi:DNA-binding NarL/FixJ family response regulator
MERTDKIRIALAEDNPVSRKSFLEKAQGIPEWQVVFTATNGDECVEMLAALKETELPHVVFMDIGMPGMNGIATIAVARSLYPGVLFIALTVFDEDDIIFDAIRAGASGYLLKQEGQEALRSAVTDLLGSGGAPMSPAIARKTLALLSKMPAPDTKQENPVPDHLTGREKEILQYTVSGWDAKRIAAKLDISTLTVRKHIANLYQKLHVRSRAEIISMAHKNNWTR